jgi:hypothetical protein
VANGIEVIDVAEEHSDLTLERLAQALRLLQDVDRRRYERFRKNIKRIILVKAGGPEFASELNACVLRSGYLREGSPRAVATTLVHEAAHARLVRAGIGYGLSVRDRVELICVREQIAFAEKLGDEGILDHLRQKLQRPWWTPAQLRERRVEAWERLGVPRWMLRLYQRCSR